MRIIVLETVLKLGCPAIGFFFLKRSRHKYLNILKAVYTVVRMYSSVHSSRRKYFQQEIIY